MDWSILSAIANTLQALALVVVGGWVLYKIQTERTHYPHMEFSINCNFYGPHGNNYVAEYLISINNRGFVQQGFKEILLGVHGIDENEPEVSLWKNNQPGYGKSYDDRLFCPTQLIKNQNVIPERYELYLVEPNCEETIRYVTIIPSNVKYILAHAEYLYSNTLRRKGKPQRPRTTERFLQVQPLAISF